MERPLCCILVGLPARGKTFLARKIARYLNWLGLECRVFNVGEYRRAMFGAAQPSSFFDPDNSIAERHRQEAALACLQDMLQWLRDDADMAKIAVYDATNSTRARRQLVTSACDQGGVSVMLIESILNDEAVVRENVLRVKMASPDYAEMRAGDAPIADFMERIAHYQRAYQPVGPDEEQKWPVVRLIDLGRRYEVSGLDLSNNGGSNGGGSGSGGNIWAKTRIAHLLVSLEPHPKPIFVCRHGETIFNLAGKIGGDSELSAGGWHFAQALPQLMSKIASHFDIWTSSFQRTIQTATFFPTSTRRIEWKALDEIDAGVCEGLTYDEIATRHPREFAARDQDKFRYRYKAGESYADLINRLEPVVMELERSTNPILIIGHQAVLRGIIGYFMERCHAELPYIQVPLHCIVELVPTAYGCGMREYRIPGVPAGACTHRPKPNNNNNDDTLSENNKQ